MLETYAQWLATLVGALSGLPAEARQLIGTGFVLNFEAECTAAAVSAAVAATAGAMTPASLGHRLATGLVVAAAMQIANIARLLAIALAGEYLGAAALQPMHDWLAPAAMAAATIAAWTLWWRVMSNRYDVKSHIAGTDAR